MNGVIFETGHIDETCLHMIDCSSKSFIPKGAVAIYRAAPFIRPLEAQDQKPPETVFQQV